MNSLSVLTSTELEAQIDPLGAQLSVLRDRNGRDLLWHGDPTIWAGRAPILFPIVGALTGGAYRLGAEVHQLPRHGFARGSRFETVRAERGSAVFRLYSNADTHQIYPFDFELDVRFALDGATLTVSSVIRNTGSVPLPASHGYHPAFRWPLPYGHDRASHFIEFALEESAHIRRLNAQGLLTPELQATPLEGRRLRLRDSLFKDDAVIFEQVRSRSVRYGATEGPRIEVRLFDAPYLGIWTKPGAQFICIEPWHGVADPQGFAGDFRDKPGILVLAPGAERALDMSITLLPE